VGRVVKGVETAMAAGELPLSLVTKNVQISVTSALVSGIGGTVLATPSSPSDLAYGVLPPTLTLGTAGLSQCPYIGSYAQLSVLQWSTNPYANSKSMKSALISFTAQPQDASKSATKSLVRSNTYPLSGVPAYTLAFQFSAIQDFNFSAALNYTGTVRSKSNFTIPACTRYNGVSYLPCNGCNLTSYTNYNVTYTCYDVQTICPSVVFRRSLKDEEVEEEEGEVEEGSAESSSSSRSMSMSRLLQTADDDGNDGSGSGGSPSTYGTLVQSVAAELSQVLSQNPFAQNLSQSTVVLTFVGCLTGFIFLMLLYLLRRDDEEKLHRMYVKTESDLKAKKLLEDDIKNGRKGDNGVLYQGHLSKFKREAKRNDCISSRFHRTAMSGYDVGLMKLFVKKTADKDAIYPSLMDSRILDDISEDSDSMSGDFTAGKTNLSATEASVTEFLHKLFPGHAIFTKKTSAMVIIAVNHDYFKMFGGSTMTRTRTIRFLELVTLVLVTLFVDTVFFGVFYPTDLCALNTDKVSIYHVDSIHTYAFQSLHSSTYTKSGSRTHPNILKVILLHIRQLLEIHKDIFIVMFNMHHQAITFITTIETTINNFCTCTFIHYNCLDFMHCRTIQGPVKGKSMHME
jgi:hypothetical protein